MSKVKVPIYYYMDDEDNAIIDFDAIGDEICCQLRRKTQQDVDVVITCNGKQTWENR
tara:strand:- start:390 stop:560 length:171 start_codon:yes stop_codon:yes gene_type:complete